MSEGGQEKVEFVLSGLGGHGILTIGLLLAQAGLLKFRHVSWFPSYETFQRGGKVFCHVVLSQDRVLSPVVSEPDVLIVTDDYSLETNEEYVMEGGILAFDRTIVDASPKRKDIKIVDIPSTEMAKNLGSTQVSNLILLGACIGLNEFLTMNTLETGLEAMLKNNGKEKLIPLNKEALNFGYNLMKEK